MLKVVDTKWMAHIDDMSELKKGIGLRAYGQQNPVVEYRYEGFEMFDAMVASIKEDTIRMLLTMQLRQNQAPEREQVSKPDAPHREEIRHGLQRKIRSKQSKNTVRMDGCDELSGKSPLVFVLRTLAGAFVAAGRAFVVCYHCWNPDWFAVL